MPFIINATDKANSFGVKPLIKKGYYPIKLLSVVPYADDDGKPVDGQYGHQMILEFGVYKPNDKGLPVAPMTFVPDPEHPDVTADVVIPKFVYYEYYRKEKKKIVPGEFESCISAGSRPGKIVQALGWEFKSGPLDVESLIGNWAEANIDDYEKLAADKKTVEYTCSSIKEISKYAGPKIEVDPDEAEAKGAKMPADESAQVEEEFVEDVQASEDIKKLEDKKALAKEMMGQGNLTKEGYESIAADVDKQLEALKK